MKAIIVAAALAAVPFITPLPAGCVVVETFEDRSAVAECPDGSLMGRDPETNSWSQLGPYDYVLLTDADGFVHRVAVPAS